jgi:predicted PhzF superfamily epimerase YddE/YHI9
LPPADPSHRAMPRLFTPAAELPFAGHPTVGTAIALARTSLFKGFACPRNQGRTARRIIQRMSAVPGTAPPSTQ